MVSAFFDQIRRISAWALFFGVQKLLASGPQSFWRHQTRQIDLLLPHCSLNGTVLF
jgi:hypothetical protein